MTAELPLRQRRLGLAPTTQLPVAAELAGGFAMLVPHLARVQWSTDLDAVERVLGHLQASLREEVSG